MDSSLDTLLTHPSMIQRAVLSSGRDVWRDFLCFYEPFINGILTKMNFKGADMDDVRQQVFLKLWQQLSAYRSQPEKAKFRSWLAVVIRNVAIDWLRGRKSEALEQFGGDELLESHGLCDPEIDLMIEKEWQRHVVATAVERLRSVFSGKAFEVLRLSLEGASAEEISRILSIRLESVYVLRSRVKTRVGQEIAQIRQEQEGGCGGT